MKAAIAALTVGLGLAAHAGVASAKGCHSRSHIVGHDSCHTFGAGWEPPMITWGFEGVFLHFDPGGGSYDLVDKNATHYHFQTIGSTKINAFAGRYRYQLGWRGYYLADEFTFGGTVSGPGLEGGPVTSPGSAMADALSPVSSASGFTFEWDLALGKQVSVGRLFYAAELAGGVRVVSYNTGYPLVSPIATAGLIEPRLRGGLWLNHWLSVTAFAGANVLSTGDYEVGISLGLHAIPYDGSR
ncbi:MAG TPA: hypothetical protein VGM88_03340 [Kofleriaceae bacterium]|jgi:hypothetical protein